jgi:sulfatase maturation enzyme AslB (radical SAM superfamily)
MLAKMSSGQFWHEEREFERSADFPRHGQAHRLHGVPYNTLTCVHRFNGRRPLDVYRFLRQELGSTYIQFIPVVEHKSFERVAPQTWQPEMLPKDGEAAARPGHPDSVVMEWSVDPEDWGYFLCRGFKTFFAHALPEVERIATKLRQEPPHPKARI